MFILSAIHSSNQVLFQPATHQTVIHTAFYPLVELPIPPYIFPTNPPFETSRFILLKKRCHSSSGIPVRGLGPFGTVLGPFAQVLVPSGRVLGPFAQVLFYLGRVLGPFGFVLGHFGTVLGPFAQVLVRSGRVLGPFCTVLGPFARVLCSLGTVLGPFCTVLGPFRSSVAILR